ncbi:hypothetical protein GQ53DRAFT_367194 [Thozetella sp. PMI_491]|nr:hypothetical protein GQ53DRAFT_367194 [Thozetella sp. PMI_491]
MHFTAATVLAFAASALAQTLHFDAITKPGQSETIPAGSKYTIQWEPSTEYSGTVSLSVIGGASPQTLQPVADIAKSVDNSLGTYDWAVPSSLGSLAVYGIQITLDSNSSIFQYSFPFLGREHHHRGVVGC